LVTVNAIVNDCCAASDGVAAAEPDSGETAGAVADAAGACAGGVDGAPAVGEVTDVPRDGAACGFGVVVAAGAAGDFVVAAGEADDAVEVDAGALDVGLAL
jgi:hypothetical protein